MSRVMYLRALEIQTTTICNGKCIVCPHKDIYHKNPPIFMDFEIFKKIIDQIKDDIDVRIIPYLNCEPLADNHIWDKLKYIRQVCPNHQLELSSNISLLTFDDFKYLRDVHINDFRISCFGFEKETYEKMMPGLSWESSFEKLYMLAEYYFKEKPFDQLSLVMIEHDLVPQKDYDLAIEFCNRYGIKFNKWGFLDRAGNVKNFKNKIVRRSGLYTCQQKRPYERLHILANGNIIACCQDWREEIVLGNIHNNSIQEIWSSSLYQLFRQKIANKYEETPDLCKRCKLFIPINDKEVIK